MICIRDFGDFQKMSREQQQVSFSIARYLPKGFDVLQFLFLVPKDTITSKYKKDNDLKRFQQDYRQQLSELSQEEIAYLDNKILLYDKNNGLPYVQVLRDWLEKECNKKVEVD